MSTNEQPRVVSTDLPSTERSVSVLIRLSPQERDAWQKAAGAQGRSTAGWVRQVVADRIDGSAGASVDPVVGQVRAELVGIGTALNRLVHEVHQAGQADGIDVDAVVAAVNEARVELGAVRDVLKDRP